MSRSRAPEAQPHHPCADGQAGAAVEGFTALGPQRLLAVLSKDQQEGRVFSPLAWEQRPGSTCAGTLSAQLWRLASPRPAEDGAGTQRAAAGSVTSGGFTACSGDVRMNGRGGLVFLTWSLTLAVDFWFVF